MPSDSLVGDEVFERYGYKPDTTPPEPGVKSYDTKSEILQQQRWTLLEYIPEEETKSMQGFLDFFYDPKNNIKEVIGPGAEGRKITILSREEPVPELSTSRAWYWKEDIAFPPRDMHQRRIVLEFTEDEWKIVNHNF